MHMKNMWIKQKNILDSSFTSHIKKEPTPFLAADYYPSRYLFTRLSSINTSFPGGFLRHLWHLKCRHHSCTWEVLRKGPLPWIPSREKTGVFNQKCKDCRKPTWTNQTNQTKQTRIPPFVWSWIWIYLYYLLEMGISSATLGCWIPEWKCFLRVDGSALKTERPTCLFPSAHHAASARQFLGIPIWSMSIHCTQSISQHLTPW